MATIATTTNTTPFIYPSTTLLDRELSTGYLYCMIKASTADNYAIYRSTNGGTSWASFLNVVRTNVVEIGSIFVHDDGWLYWCYRTNESSQDRLYFRRCDLAGSGSWQAELMVSAVPNGGVAGTNYTGLDMAVIKTAFSGHFICIAVGVTTGSTIGMHAFGVIISPVTGVPEINNGIIAGTRIWMYTDSGRITPSIDLEHQGNAKQNPAAPNLWIAYGRSKLFMVKLAWTGGGWIGPVSPVTIAETITATDSIAARWDGNRWLMAIQNPASTSTVVVHERNQANSATIARTTGIHPTGVIRSCTLSYSSASGDIRVYAVGTSSTVLYYTDYIRATGVWSSWTSVIATAVLGATGNNYGVRRSSYADARYSVYTAHAASSTIHTSQTLSYAPNTPTWTTAGLSYVDGGAADVATTLTLDWVFSDPDTADTQGWYAISRQIGAGALAYWRASDSTWQVAEVQNAGATTLLLLAAAWGVDGAAAHVYKAKTWDVGGVASGYSAALTIIPSAKVNPVLTAPTDASTVINDSVIMTWTVAEQVQYRATLHQAAVDTFTRVTASAWGTATSGKAWTASGGAAADFATTGSVGTIACTAVNSSRRVTMADNLADVEVLVSVSVSVVALGAAISPAVLLRTVDSSTDHYRVQLNMGLLGVLSLSIISRVAGVDTTLATGTVTGTYSAATLVKIRARIEGSAIFGKAWLASGSEPDNWIAQVSDTTFTDSAPVGVRTILGAANTNTLPVTTTFDNFVRAALPATWDSGWVASADARTVTPAAVLPDLTYWVSTIATRNLDALASLNVGAWFTVDYIEPAVPTLVCAAVPASGWIAVAITNPAPSGGQPALSYNDLYRRETAIGDNGVRVASALASGATYNDWRARSSTAYQYRALAVGANGTSIYGAWTA